MVGAEMQRDPQGILFHTEHPLQDLQGSAGQDADGRRRFDLDSGVAQETRREFNLMPLVGDLARFMNNPEFVQQCFVTNEPFFARQRGANVGALLIASDTYEPYRVMFAGEEFLAQHPDIVGKFVRASIQRLGGLPHRRSGAGATSCSRRNATI